MTHKLAIVRFCSKVIKISKNADRDENEWAYLKLAKVGPFRKRWKLKGQ